MNETKSVKALKKQLAAAIAMVMVAAIALASSTYAWFVNNSVVTATGMQVQAQTEGGIEIAYSDADSTDGAYASSATTGASSAITLAPISTLNTSAWYHAGAIKSSESAGNAESYETYNMTESNIENQAFGKVGKHENTSYYMVQNFNIRSTSSTSLAKGLSVDSVSVTGASANMSQALRVAVKVGNGTALIYDPNGEKTSYTVYSGHTGTGSNAQKTTAGTVNCTDKSTKTVLTNASDTIAAKGTNKNGGVDVKVYIWFEGEDTQLYSDNFTAENLTVTVQFSATTADEQA